MAAGRLEEAREVATTAFERFRTGNDAYYEALAATALAGIAMAQGNLPLALDLGLKGVRAHLSIGDLASATLALRSATMLLLVAGMPAEAAMTFGAFGAYSRRHGYRPPLDVEHWLTGRVAGAEVETVLGGPELADARARGAAMTFEEFVALLEDIQRRGVGPFGPPGQPSAG
jgi:hypothetical protein